MSNTGLLMAAVNLEYRLQIAAHIDCWCSRYLAERREVLIPELIKAMQNKVDFDGDECQFVADFVNRLHIKKCPTMKQPQPYMEVLMKQIRDEIDATPPEELEVRRPYPVPCKDCGAAVGQSCVSGCPNLD